jgi:DNA repair exonuclease SbcCD ATPase subunit
MMFRRSKFQPLPTPPTEEQISEDLETFHIEKVKDENETLSEIQENQIELNIDEWWKIFEKYLENYKELKEIKKDISDLKATLLQNRNQLVTDRATLEKQIANELVKIKQVIN